MPRIADSSSTDAVNFSSAHLRQRGSAQTAFSPRSRRPPQSFFARTVLSNCACRAGAVVSVSRARFAARFRGIHMTEAGEKPTRCEKSAVFEKNRLLKSNRRDTGYLWMLIG
jgi:hypothetical protein